MSGIKKLIIGLVLSVSVLFGTVAVASPPSGSTADGNYAQCILGATVQDWANKNPRDCTTAGTCALLKDWQVVLRINGGNGTV